MAGLPVYAAPGAAVTFDDDLDVVRGMGVEVLEGEMEADAKAARVELRDLDLDMIRGALSSFEVSTRWDVLAAAVFDHGNAPPGYSDRKFRFDHLREQVTEGKRDVSAFCYAREELPEYMTRMRAVARSADPDVPMLLMDTAEAAVLGTLEDPLVASRECKLAVNIGNEHTLAFHMHGSTIHGLVEHHTHLLSRERLESYLGLLSSGALDDQEVWLDGGHGAISLEREGHDGAFLAVTGPRRDVLRGSRLEPYLAAPHGDMMLAGPFGLVRACAERFEPWRAEIMRALGD